MEAVNGDKGGPPPPSPLTGCYLLVVIGEPHSQEHKDIILQRVAKGLLSWDVNNCLVDLEKELSVITEQAPDGEEARYGERLIQFASENLVTEVLIHPVVSTLAQCVRNLLSSFTRHRHIVHAGYTFAANGSWILQDGTFSYLDFAEAFQEIDVQRVIRAYENSIGMDVHCSPEGDWIRLPKESFTKGCNVRLNPNDVLTSGSPAINGFINYLCPFLVPTDTESLLESSDVVGNIRFSHPTLYIFPGGQGDAALFGINGFNMLLDGGFSRKACFWDFVRHLDRLDAVLLTRLNNSNIMGISSVLRRKKQNAVYPQIGHFFCNIREKKAILSPDGDKDKDPLLINLLEEGQDILSSLTHLNLSPQPCYRDSEPINLYHKVGHGTLDMYVLSPAKDSKELKDFLQKWNTNDQKLFANQKFSKELPFPLPNLVSICALLVWQPANPNEMITRILFPGSCPQTKVFEGLDRLKQLEFVKHPTCSESSLTPVIPIKSKTSIEKIIAAEIKPQRKTFEPKKTFKDEPKKILDNNKKDTENDTVDKSIKKSDSTESDKPAKQKPKKTESDSIVAVNGKSEEAEATKIKTEQKPKPKPEPKRTKPIEKKISPTAPKSSESKASDLVKARTALKASPGSTPAKSAKEANNRKVVESKYKQTPPKKDVKPEKKEVKPVVRRPKGSPLGKVPGSPLKKVNGVAKSEKKKLDKEGTTDSSTVSTPSADQESVLKKDISKLTPEEIANLKAEELAELKEEQEIVKEIEAVFKKGEQKKEKHSDMRKIKDLSSEEKEPEEYLIIEKEEIVIEDKSSKEDEIQKLTRDSEESEKKRAKQDETSPKIEETETTKPAITTETPKERSLGSQDDKIDTSGEKVDNKEAVAPESQPDEKISGTIESGATTAPTLPEDERITLDEIKEDQVIEEKHVKEETKEKDVPVVQVETKIVEPVSKLPPVVGIRLEKQPNMRDLVKTPDEVADLPMHEEVDIENYVDYQYKSDQVEDGRVKSDDSAGKKSKEVAEKPIEKQIEKKAEMVKGLSDQEAKEVTTWLEGGPQEDSGVFDNDVQEAKVSGIAIEEQKQEKVEEIVTETEVKTKESGTEKQVQNEMEGTKETIIEKTDIGKKEDVAQETKEESEEAVKLETKESVIASKDAEQIQGDSKIVSPKKGEEIIDDKHVSPVQEDDIKEAVTQDEHKTIDTETTKQIEFAEESLKEEKQVKTELGKLEEVSNLQTGPRKESITTITPKEEGEVQGVQEIKLEEVAEKSSKEKETVEEDSNVLISSRKESISEMTVTKEAKQQETEEIKYEAVEQISNVQICPKKESVSQDSKQHEPQSIPPKEDKHEADDIKFTDDTNKILEEETTAKEVTHLQISSRKESIAEISKDLEQNEEKSVAPKEEHDIEETKLNEFLDKEITENELINSQIAGKKESNAEITKDLEEQQKSVSPKKEAKDQETEETKLKDEINTFLEKEKADETSNLQVCPRKESVAEVMHELEESDVSPLVNEVPAHYKISEQVVEDIKDGNKLSLKEAEHVKAEEVKIEEVSGLQICPRMESVAAIDKEAAIEVDKTEDLEAIAPKDLKGQDTYKHETESKQVMESQESKKIDDSELQSKEIPKDLHKADEKVVGSEVEQTIASVSQLDAKQEQEQEIKDEKFEEKRVEETTEKESERKLSLSHAGAHEGINEAEEKKEEALVSQEADLNKKKAETKSENIVESEKIEEKQDLEKEIIEEKEEKIKINETEKIVSDKKLVQDEKDDKDEKEKKDKKDVKDEVTHEQEKHATAESKIVAEAELKLESKIDAAESVQEIKEETIKTNETIKESEVKSKPEEVVEKLLDESDKNIKDTNVFEEFIASIDKEIEQTSTELQKSEIDKSKPDMEQIEKDFEKGIDQIKEDAKEAKQHIEEKMQKLGSDMEEIEQRVETFVEQTHEGAKQIQEHITNVIEAIQNESDQVKMHVDENIDNVKADIEQVEEKIDDIVAKDKSIDGKDVAKTVQDDILDVASGKIKDTLIESKQAGKYIEGIVREAQQEVKDFQANVDEVGKEVYKANDQIKEQIKETLDELSEMKVVEKNLEEMLEKEKEGAEFLEKRVEDIISEKEISSQIKADLKDLKNDLSDYIDTKHKEAKEMEEKIDNKMRQMSLEIANVQDVVSDVLQETKEESKQIEDGLHDFVKEKGDEISEKVDKLLSGAEALGDVVCGKMNELFGIESKKPDEQIQESEKPRKYSDKLAGETKVLSADVEKKFETHIQSTDEVKTEIVEAPSIKLSTTTSEVKKDEVEKFVEADTEKCDKPKEVDSSENASEEIIQNGFGGISPETEIEKLPKASSSDTKLSDELKEAEILLQKSTTEEKSESQKSFELSLLKQTELIDKAELGSKSPKEREEDVAKIVASVAEVLKSDAPLEEFEGKLPLTTLLRETHITTVDSPVTSQPPLTKELEPIDETKTSEEEQKSASESKRSSLIKDSAELMEATSKMISSIKSSKCESDNDPQTVHKMLVTASSEDGGEETVICPSGSIKFSKSSESSGRSTPDVTGDRKKSSATDSEVDKTEFSQDTVKEKDQDEATEKGEKDVKKLEEERHEMVKDESVKKIVDEEMRKIEVSGEAKEKSSTEDKEHVEEEKFKTESSEKEVEKQVEHKSEEVKDGGDVLKHKKLSEHDEHAQEEKIKSVTTEDVKKSDEKPIEDHSKSILEEVGRRSETVKEESVDSEHKKLSQDDEHVQEEKIKSVCTQEVKQAGEKLIEDHSKSIVEQADHKSEKIKDEGDDKKLSEDDEHVQEKKIKTVSTEEVKKSDEKPIEDHSKSILEQVDHKSEAVKEESLKHVSNDSEDKKLSEDKEIAEEEKIKSKITEEVKKPDETPTKDFRKSELEHIDHKIETTKEESLKPIEDDKRKSLSEDEEHVKEEKVKSASPEEIKKLDEVEDHKSKTTKEESFKAETLKSTEAVIVDVDPTKKQSEAITETKVATAEEKSEAPIPEKQHLQDDKQLAEKLKEDVIHVKTVSEKLEMLKSSEQPEVAGPSSSTPKLPKEDQDLSGKSTPDIAEVEKIKEMQEILKHEKHIPGSSTPPTAPASPIVKETPEESTKEDTKQASDYSDDEDDIPGSPASMTSQAVHSHSSSHYELDEDKSSGKVDLMNASLYGSLPQDEAPSYLHEITKAKYSSKETLEGESSSELMTASFIGAELPGGSVTDEAKEVVASWGKPLGLPSPAPPADNRGTPKKERKLPANVSAKNKLNDDRKRSESPSKYDKKPKKFHPVYVDLTYVPHNGNANYSFVDFFKRIRARYYVFSGIEPSKEVYNALLEAKQTWENNLEVTIIPTYDTDILGYWVAENEDLLTKYKIDLSPSASRCTINLQDHETSCSAYRLEF